MELGMTFEGFGSKMSISTTQEDYFRETVSEALSYSSVETIAYQCGEDDGQLHALWQWVIGTEDDSITAHSNHAICRSGPNA